MTRRHLATLLVVFVIATASAQETPQNGGALQSNLNPGPATILSTSSVIELHNSHIDDSVILAKLSQANHPLNLSTDDILTLKQAGISDAVVRAMLSPSFAAPQRLAVRNESYEKFHSMNPTGATPSFDSDTPALDPDDPLAPHESGIYLAVQQPDGKTKLVFLDRVGVSGVKMNAGAVFSFFAYPVHLRYEIPSPKAEFRTMSPTPVFYFYFDDKAAGLGKSAFAAANVSSPNQFHLEQFITGKKERELTAMKFGIFSGVSDGEKHLTFTSERIRPGLYRVTVTQPLKPGEYCLVAPAPGGATAATQQDPANAPKPDIFDFGVDVP